MAEDSILKSTKKLLGIAEDNSDFDLDIITQINSVFTELNTLGIGPAEGFTIEDDTTNWVDYLANPLLLNGVKTLVFLKVRLLFDPPGTSFLLAAMQEQANEYQWRLNVIREGALWPEETPVVVET